MDLAGQHGRGLIFPGTGFSARCAVPVVFRGGHQKWCPPLIFSVLKARNRNDADTVTAFVRKWCHAAENHKERRLFHFPGVYPVCQPEQAFSSLAYQPVTAELNFNEAIASISQMHHSIAFEAGLVPVMINIASDGIGINPEIPDTQILKHQSHKFQIIDQILRKSSFWQKMFIKINALQKVLHAVPTA